MEFSMIKPQARIRLLVFLALGMAASACGSLGRHEWVRLPIQSAPPEMGSPDVTLGKLAWNRLPPKRYSPVPAQFRDEAAARLKDRPVVPLTDDEYIRWSKLINMEVPWWDPEHKIAPIGNLHPFLIRGVTYEYASETAAYVTKDAKAVWIEQDTKPFLRSPRNVCASPLVVLLAEQPQNVFVTARLVHYEAISVPPITIDPGRQGFPLPPTLVVDAMAQPRDAE